jgi:benzoyl-CoA reductase/2-hydroxyglutaryl-CoA dehydratase subunit BcrC/BadD/HgdB
LKYSNLDYFERFGEQSLLALDTVKKAGRKVFGIYCTFAPVELVWAAGAVPVGLCCKKEGPIAEAEKTLPVNLCPLIKSSYGYAVTDNCPFFAASDLLIGETTCTGIKSFDRLIDETDEDPYRAMARYCLQTPCSCLTPNTGRFDLIGRLIRDFNVQGVVDLTWRCCLTYSVEAHLLQKFLGHNGQVPFLHLETDYSLLDLEQLKTRIEAFLEMIAGR